MSTLNLSQNELQNLDNLLWNLNQTMRSFAIQVNSSFGSVVSSIREVSAPINNLNSNFSGLTQTLRDNTAAAGRFSLSLGDVIGAAGTVVGGLELMRDLGLGEKFKAWTKSGSQLGAALGGLKLKTVALTGATGIAAIVALFVAFSDACGWLKIAIGALSIVLAVAAIKWTAKWGAATLGISVAIKAIIAGLVAIGAGIVALFSSSLEEIQEFGDAVSEETRKIMEPILDLSNKATNELSEMFVRAVPMTEENTRQISGYFREMADNIINEHKRVKNSAIENLAAMFGEEAQQYERSIQRTNQLYDNKIQTLDRWENELARSISEVRLRYGEESEAYRQAVEELNASHQQRVEESGKSRDAIEAQRQNSLERLREEQREQIRSNENLTEAQREQAVERLNVYFRERDGIAETYQERIDIVENSHSMMNEITVNAMKEGRELTQGELGAMQTLRDGIFRTAAETMARDYEEKEELMSTFHQNTRVINTENVGAYLREQARKRDENVRGIHAYFAQKEIELRAQHCHNYLTFTESGQRKLAEIRQQRDQHIEYARQTYRAAFQAMEENFPEATANLVRHTGEQRTLWNRFRGWFTRNRYADGGFPSMGEMFIAREAGPELVGSIGNRNAVVNNNQIVESVSKGVFDAVSAALSGYMRHSSSQDVRVYLDGKEIYINQLQQAAANRMAPGLNPAFAR